jgi:ATP-dependent Clp protease ATP-binding subunit ClpC
MFERYTERARRVIFVARDEAARYDSRIIETEHFLLALFHQDPELLERAAPKLTADEVRATLPRPIENPRSGDRQLSRTMQRVLNLAAKEADRLESRIIGTDHLLMGLLRVEDCAATKLLIGGGAHV